ncbi:MAG: flavodoxin-dependent (E)-4-hydroxy-3-methylbut-2-enyl-diphosphate synthase [Firmicutes bacterium]|nr:flavodoxin-dependent (E)-4-hydroxy-3-methylbut-2-enyl-diphosphate synthase [Bacillota bacterium]
MTKNKTKVIRIGAVSIGGGNPVAIQSMTKTDTRDVEATVAQIMALAACGCEIARVAVPDMAAAEAIREIRRRVPAEIPIVADVHFDYRIALAAIENGADKLRINPGNIGGPDRLRPVAEAAKRRGIPIRVGVNSGSLERDIYEKHGGVTPEGLAESALRGVGMLEDFDFGDIVVSIKSSDVPLCVKAYELLARRTAYPLHIGITEAGTEFSGAIKSAVGLGSLLLRGIGDTLRVSLTGDPLPEVRCAKEILRAAGLRRFGVEVVSCPTCGRTGINVEKIAAEIEKRCAGIEKSLKVAVMGCVVNGPGEAKDADVGVAGGDGAGALFSGGKILRTLPEEEIADALMKEIMTMENQR